MPSIETITALLLAYRYIVIIPLSLVAQPLVGMISGVLARLGYFDIFALYGVLLATAVAGDAAWYWIGRRWGEGFVARFGRYVSVTPAHIRTVKRIFNRYHTSILLFSKVTNGMGMAWVTLFTAGMTRIPFGRYLLLNTVGEGVWSAMILAVGYFFSHLYLTVHDAMGKLSLVAATIVFAALLIGFWIYVRRRIVREFEEE